MQDSEFVAKYFKKFSNIDQDMLETNRSYFEGLLNSFKDNSKSDLRMWVEVNENGN